MAPISQAGRNPHEDGVPGGRPTGNQRPKRLTGMRERWRNASLKTSFMVYMLVFLVAAIVLSLTTAAFFGNVQNRVGEDGYDQSGLFVYDANTAQLVPARSIAIDTEGSAVFVEAARDSASRLAAQEIAASTLITDASDYYYARDLSASANSDETAPPDEDGNTGADTEELDRERGAASSGGTLTPEPETQVAPESLAVYDEAARRAFDEWAAAHPESPYSDYFGSSAGAEVPNNTEAVRNLLVSPIGYYLYTPPSAEASALSSLFGLLAFLMFPLWFGMCIFAAAHRFYRLRLAPGLTVLDDATAKIANQNLDFHVCYDREDEMGRLATSFETMRSSLAESQRALWRTAEERKRLNAAFAHDLRTPLTILKGKIELLEARAQSGTTSPEQLGSSIQSLAEQVQRLERYVSAMSGLQKLEDRVAEPGDASFDDVARLIEDIGHGLASNGNPAFSLYASPHCAEARPRLHVDRAIVAEVAENLIGNALRYAHANVCARLDVEGEMLVLIVDDDGPGFSPEALANGCAPFFSEAPSKDHFGLGLNIAAMLCERHGGSLALANRGQGGARVVARFAQT